MTDCSYLNKKNIVTEIHRSHDEVEESVLEKMVDTVFDEMATALVCGDRVEIRGFGSLVVKKRARGMVRNPKSGEVIESDERGDLYFRASRDLIKMLNSEASNDN